MTRFQRLEARFFFSWNPFVSSIKDTTFENFVFLREVQTLDGFVGKYNKNPRIKKVSRFFC